MSIRQRFALNNTLFVVMLLCIFGLIAFLSKRYNFESDWTQTNRNTLSAASQQLLSSIKILPEFTIYATEQEQIRKPITDLLHRYQRIRPHLVIKYVNPELDPDQMRELGIKSDGVLGIALNGRTELLDKVNEQNITNAIQRLTRNEERWLLFIEGHGERKPHSVANHDLGEWGTQLSSKGIKIRSYSISENPVIPLNASAVVIASPQLDYLAGEQNAIIDYVNQGGNLLWFAEPGSLHKLDKLSKLLSLDFEPGTIVDPNSQLLGINDPRFTLVTEYTKHVITDNFNAVTLFPQARGIKLLPSSDWQRDVILNTMPRSWSEVGQLSGKIQFNAETDIPGPLVLGVALTRHIDTPTATTGREQRLVVVGDGDFLSNAYLGNGGNLNLGMNMVNWLTHDDQFISIPASTAIDINLQLSSTAQMIIAFGFLVVIPLVLAISGATLWYKRRLR